MTVEGQVELLEEVIDRQTKLIQDYNKQLKDFADRMDKIEKAMRGILHEE